MSGLFGVQTLSLPKNGRNSAGTSKLIGGKEREDQPKSSAIHPLKAVRQFCKGIITKAELSSFVFDRLTKENVQEFLDGCPADILQYLKESANRFPANEDNQGWDQLICIEGASYFP